MPWVTIYWKDDGELYAVGWPNVETPYPGETMFGRVETQDKPDPRRWDPASREYKLVRVRDNPPPIGRPKTKARPPVDPIVSARAVAEIEGPEALDAFEKDLAIAQALGTVDAFRAAKKKAMETRLEGGGAIVR